MSPEEFKNTWNKADDTLHPFCLETLQDLNLNPATIGFLTMAGLPADAAPFLSFVQDKAELYNSIGKLTRYYNFLPPEFAKYVVIGHTADGDVIAIDTENEDQVAYLDHEDNFSSRFFNTNINALAGCLVVYRSFEQTVTLEHGENAWIESVFTDEQFETLKQGLIAADSRALVEDGFWKEDLEIELETRNENRNTGNK